MNKEISLWDAIGLILTVVSFAALFNDKMALGIVGLVFVIGLFWLSWFLNRPVFTYIEIEKELTIHDAQAQRSTVIRRLVARANHKGQTENWCRNISTDGTIDTATIRVDGQAPGPQDTAVVAGKLAICKRFQHPLKRGERFTTQLSWDVANDFQDSRNSLRHTVATQTGVVIMRIQFPVNRPCLDASLYFGYGGENELPLPKPELSGDRREIKAKIKRPKLGAEYVLEFDW